MALLGPGGPHGRAQAGVIVTVRLTPRGGRDAIEGVDEAGRLRVRVAAPPVDGAANRSLVRLVAGSLALPPSMVELESRAAGRLKRLRIRGVTPEALLASWPGLAILDVPRRAIGSVG